MFAARKYGKASVTPGAPTSGGGVTFNPQAKRIAAIKSQHPLSVAAFSVYEQPQITKYGSYVRKLKRENSTVVEGGCQFNEGGRGAGVQTEEVGTSEKACFVMNGQDDTTWATVLEACNAKPMDKMLLRKTMKIVTDEKPLGRENKGGGLEAFLSRASGVCESLLEENLNRENLRLKKKSAKPDGIFDGSSSSSTDTNKWVDFQLSGALQDWPATAIETSQAKGSSVFTIHPAAEYTGSAPELAGKSLVVVWETYDLSKVSNVMFCNGNITACELGDVGHFVMAGMDDGSLAVWDLREGKGKHVNKMGMIVAGSKLLPVRSPSAETNCMGRGDRAHASKIVGLVVREGAVESLDDRGQLTSWFITGEKKGAVNLSPNRSVWVGEGGLIECEEDLTERWGGGEAEVGPEFLGLWDGGGSGKLLVARSGGRLVSVDKFSGDMEEYEGKEGGAVVSVSRDYFGLGLFLVSRGGGAVDLFKGGNSGRLMSWGAECWGETMVGGDAVKVMWSSHRPGVFYVGVGSKMKVVDLMSDDSGPVEGLEFEWGNDKGGGGIFACTKGRRSVGKVWLVVGGGGGGVKGRRLCDEFVEEKKTLSEDDELDWVRRWTENVVC